MKSKKEKRNRHEKTQRAKLLLLSGRKIKVNELDRLLNVNNSPEIISRLRKSGMHIDCKMFYPKDTNPYGVYSYVPPKKVDRIKTRQYMDQA